MDIMESMSKRERIQAAVRGKEVDRIPFSVWYGCPQYDQDPIALAEEEVRQARAYDVDFIKINPNALYVAQDYGLSLQFFCTLAQNAKVRRYGIRDVKEWGELRALPATYGTYGKTLQIAHYMRKELNGEDIPFIQTIFSPLTIAKKLAGDRTLEDMRNEPEIFSQALQAITDTLIHFVQANKEEGVSGFFCGTNTATTDQLSPEEFERFEAFYYRQVFEAMGDDVLIKMLHAHGDHTYFKEMAEYDVNCIHWHSRTCSWPDMREARGLTNKCLAGGIDENWLAGAKPEEIYGHIKEAVDLAGRNGLIVGPGCTCKGTTPEQNFRAVGEAVKLL